MNIQKINGDDIKALGFPKGIVIGFALNKIEKYYNDYSKEEVLEILKKVLQSPADYLEDAQLSEIANELIEKPKLIDGIPETPLKTISDAYTVYGKENIEQGAITQMEVAMRLPVSFAKQHH